MIVWKFDRGSGVLHPWFSVGTLSESAFPFAPGTSSRIVITLGEPTPPRAAVKHHHRGHRPKACHSEKAARATMIARHRGEERVHSRWRPAVATGVAVGHRDPEPAEPLDPDLIEPQLLDRRTAGSRRWLARHRCRGRGRDGGHRQPPARRVGVAGWPAIDPQPVGDQWTAASLENPARVCQQLFAPALAAAFKADTGRSCLTYYSSLTSSSFRIRHVLQDGPPPRSRRSSSATAAGGATSR